MSVIPIMADQFAAASVGCYGSGMAFFDERDLWHSTIVIFTTDHGLHQKPYRSKQR
jgi:arylsulfatase A-like enzyme